METATSLAAAGTGNSHSSSAAICPISFCTSSRERLAMHHGEQVVGPGRQVARPAVAMGDRRQPTRISPANVDALVVDVPDAHPVGGVTDGVMVGHRADATDHAAGEHGPPDRRSPAAAPRRTARQWRRRGGHQRQAGLGGDDQLPLEGVRRKFGAFMRAASFDEFPLIGEQVHREAGALLDADAASACLRAARWPARTTCSARVRGGGYGPPRARR